jgi:hypothetical protein
MFGFGFGMIRGLRRGVSGLSPVMITGGTLSASISSLPQISNPVVAGGTLQATKSTLPTISDVRTQ